MNSDMEQVYRQLSESKVHPQKHVEPVMHVTSGVDLDIATTRFETTLEKRLNEIASLKSELQACKNELLNAQR